MAERVDNTKTVICHYKTYDITKRAIESFRKFYPTMQLTIVDGSGFDASSAKLYNFARADKNTSIYAHNFNIHHGPGMDMAIRGSEYEHNFILDSDAYFKKAGLIELMREKVKGREYHSIGLSGKFDKHGLDPGNSPRPEECVYQYIHPSMIMVSKSIYIQFHPYIKHGAPTVGASVDLYDRGRTDLFIPLPEALDYCHHDWKGTRDKYGIQL